jgi:hypothetical protein
LDLVMIWSRKREEHADLVWLRQIVRQVASDVD